MNSESYIDATPESGKAFLDLNIKGAVTMLNLLKFREKADYSQAKHLAPSSSISGKEAYQIYINHVKPLLLKVGAEIIYFGKGGRFVIGPKDEVWDAVIMIKHQSVEKFMAFARDEDYVKIAGHRGAALADSRLLPSTQFPDSELTS